MIEWTEQAVRQLEQAHHYIALSNSSRIVEQITTRILRSVQQLEMFPMSGRTGRVRGTRELVLAGTPFIAAYAITREHIVVLALYHGAQKWPEEF